MLHPRFALLRSCRAGNLLRARTVFALAFVLALPGAAKARFLEWESFPVTNPFSVTPVLRGVNLPASLGNPMVRLEALVGYNSGGNRFDYHSSALLPALDTGPSSRRVLIDDDVVFSSAGVQPALDGLCCSNYGKGLDDDASLHYLSDFNTLESFEIEIGAPAAGVVAVESRRSLGHDGDISDDDDDHDDDDDDERQSGGLEGTVGFRRIMVTSNFPGNGLDVHSDAGTEGGHVLETTIPDCRGVSSNWHFSRSGSGSLDESFISCVTTANRFVIKRMSHINFTVSEIVLNNGLPASASQFTYTQSRSCPLDTGYVIGTLEPRPDLGITNFYAVFLGPGGGLQGISSVVLPGARANRQAFDCEANGQFASFLYHGSGETTGTTDTFVIQTTLASTSAQGGEPMLVDRVTENRRTDWAGAFNDLVRTRGGTRIFHAFTRLQPVAELQFGTGSEVRYGGVVVPILMDDFESGDLRYWSNVVD